MKSHLPRDLRTLNEAAVLEALLSGPLTRPGIEESTGLSKPAAARLLLRVEEAGLVERAGERASRSGPPATVWQINGRAVVGAGVVVYRDQLVVELRTLDDEHLSRTEISNTAKTPGQIGALIRRGVLAACKRVDLDPNRVSQVTIGLPGIVDPHRGLLRHGLQLRAWEGVDLADVLADRLPGVGVTVSNDVTLIALAEYAYGAAAGCDSVALLWAGTGTKVSFLHNGVPFSGSHGLAGEVGSLVSPRFGPTELPPAHGGSQQLPGQGVLFEQVMNPSVVGEFVDDVSALAARLSVAFAGTAALFDPERVVLAGPAVDRHKDALVEALTEACSFLPHEVPDIVRAHLGPDAQLRGAALLSLRAAREQTLRLGSRIAAP